MPSNRYLLLDVVAVFAFVVIGRRTHEEAETLSAILRTAAPFMLALAGSWVVASWRTSPASVAAAPTVIVVTVVGGVLLRRFVALEGIAASFIVVTSLFFAAAMLGWRLVVRRIHSRQPVASS